MEYNSSQQRKIYRVMKVLMGLSRPKKKFFFFFFLTSLVVSSQYMEICVNATVFTHCTHAYELVSPRTHETIGPHAHVYPTGMRMNFTNLLEIMLGGWTRGSISTNNSTQPSQYRKPKQNFIKVMWEDEGGHSIIPTLFSLVFGKGVATKPPTGMKKTLTPMQSPRVTISAKVTHKSRSKTPNLFIENCVI